MPTDMPKVYDPSEVEGRLYRFWETSGYFRAEVDPGKRPFCIVIPPPNITGVLHIGHALDNTLQDVLIRFKRMQGYCALWIPGTDHAGIATQNVVERELRSQGLSRHDLGREQFVERVWEWRELYGHRIVEQLRRLGASCDWSRERFTMDPGLSRAVRKVFVELYEDGLIYRGNRIINWCPRCETALSDIEVDHEEHQGRLDRFRYDFEDGSGGISVATTRLETMLGDTAVAVNPADSRYAKAVGKLLVHPFSDRRLPVVADEAVDMDFGTGAVKVTPAHDATDFEISERHGIPRISILDGRAHINEQGAPFTGMDRYQAREQVRVALDDRGLYEGVTPHEHAIGKCARCGTVVEPWLSEQWFVKMQPLAQPAIAAVAGQITRFHPVRWTNYYLNWLESIRDWCISRQLWWGHRIPVWYCPDGHVFASLEDPVECPECGSAQIIQDPDVLDTWFSSQLWPFSTLGWPAQTQDLEYFYPTSVLVTGYEIIHIWVARMMMAGLRFMGQVPFERVLIHGIVRDSQGRKMSKSIGNVIDPLDLIDQFGTDALRFTLVEHATGQDIYLSTEWVAGARNFCNKLWNAARFVLANAGDREVTRLPEPAGRELSDRWILSRLAFTIEQVTARFEDFEVAAAARLIYEFIWNELCDWYIEAAKARLSSQDEQAVSDALSVLVTVLEQALRLAHPIMPFVTEEIWAKLPVQHPTESIMMAPWPQPQPGWDDPAAEQDFGRVRSIVTALRSFRAEKAIAPRLRLNAVAACGDREASETVERENGLICRLAGLESLTVDGSLAGRPGARVMAGPLEIAVELEGLIDIQGERTRLDRRIAEAERMLGKTAAKLDNQGFLSRAPAAVVAEQRRRLEEETGALQRLQSQRDSLA